MASRLGPSWLNRVQQLAGPTHAGRLGRYAVLVERVNALEPGSKPARPTSSKARPTRCSCKARQGDSLNSLLLEAFALVREAAKRAIGQRQFDVQIVGGIAIHNRCIAELETGEGKTLVATMPAFLNALAGQGRARRHGQRLPGPPRRRVDGADLPDARPDRRLHPDRPDRRRPPRRLCLRHHLRHGQGARASTSCATS